MPAHPIAGTEHSGPRSGFAELFDNRWCLIVPPPRDATRTRSTGSRRSGEGMGANVDEMDADHHDLVLAVTSHAPHLIAYTMVGVADHLRRVTDSEVIKYSAAGFRDFTRIAASDPTMWRDVFLTNKDATLDMLGRFTEELFALQRAIRDGRRRDAARLFHPHPRHPPRHHRSGPGHRRARFRPGGEASEAGGARRRAPRRSLLAGAALAEAPELDPPGAAPGRGRHDPAVAAAVTSAAGASWSRRVRCPGPRTWRIGGAGPADHRRRPSASCRGRGRERPPETRSRRSSRGCGAEAPRPRRRPAPSALAVAALAPAGDAPERDRPAGLGDHRAARDRRAGRSAACRRSRARRIAPIPGRRRLRRRQPGAGDLGVRGRG